MKVPKVFTSRSRVGPQTVQAKMPVAGGRDLKRPVAPPVYRPQPVPKVLQSKAHTPSAPHIYRPQPIPKVLQPKVQLKSRGVYRPNLTVVQPSWGIAAAIGTVGAAAVGAWYWNRQRTAREQQAAAAQQEQDRLERENQDRERRRLEQERLAQEQRDRDREHRLEQDRREQQMLDREATERGLEAKRQKAEREQRHHDRVNAPLLPPPGPAAAPLGPAPPPAPPRFDRSNSDTWHMVAPAFDGVTEDEVNAVVTHPIDRTHYRDIREGRRSTNSSIGSQIGVGYHTHMCNDGAGGVAFYYRHLGGNDVQPVIYAVAPNRNGNNYRWRNYGESNTHPRPQGGFQ